MTKEIKNKKKPIPSLAGYGGQRALQKSLERSKTVVANREAVAHTLISIAKATPMDVMTWDSDGVIIKDSKDIPDYAAQAIKKVRFNDQGQVIEIELWDKNQTLRLLAKASGMLDNPEESDKPSVIGINIKAPEVIDIEDDNGDQGEIPEDTRGREDEK